MEEEVIIPRARIAFKSYIELSAVMGFSLGLLIALFNMVVDVIQLIGGDPEVSTIGILSNLVMLITGPLSLIFTALFSYPLYKWLVNKRFSMKLTVFTLK